MPCWHLYTCTHSLNLMRSATSSQWRVWRRNWVKPRLYFRLFWYNPRKSVEDTLCMSSVSTWFSLCRHCKFEEHWHNFAKFDTLTYRTSVFGWLNFEICRQNKGNRSVVYVSLVCLHSGMWYVRFGPHRLCRWYNRLWRISASSEW